MLGDHISDLTENWLKWLDANSKKNDSKYVILSEELIRERYLNISKIDSEVDDKTRDRIIN
jgi:hypothetical protein